ncbi:osteocalcin 2-like isoform X2 [Ambystoma mexicanum]
MDCRFHHHLWGLLLLFCAVDLFGAKATASPNTLPPPETTATARPPDTNQAAIPPTSLPETTAPADVPISSTLAQNSSVSWRNLSEVASVAKVTGLSDPATSPFTITRTVTPSNHTVNSTGLTSGKTPAPATAQTTHQTTAISNTSEITATTATKEYSTQSKNNTESAKVYTEAYTSTISVKQVNLRNSEAALTIAFSVVLGIVVLMILVYSLNKCKTRRSQYSHHPLHASSYESVDRYSAPEDTLVISGGLYDAPRVYNPTMTVLEDEELHHDYVSFGSRPGQFRLEFLPGEKEAEPAVTSPAFGTFHSPHHSL